MSANKKRRSSIIIIHNNNNDMKSSHQLQQQQMAEPKDMPSVCDMTQARREEEEGDGVEIQKNRMLEMPRVCRCCCKGDMELLSLFEAAGDELINSSSTTKKSQRRRNNLATTSNEQQQQRKSVNPVEYALSGAHSSMDTVREEMIIWMLNISHNDGLPQEICRQCTAQFIMVAKFRRRCLRMQQRLQQYAHDIAEQKSRLGETIEEQLPQSQSQQSLVQLQPTHSDLPVQDNMSLPKSMTKRKRRLVLTLKSQQAKKEESEALPSTADRTEEQCMEDEKEDESTAPKTRRFHLRVRNIRVASVPPNESNETETGKTTTSRSLSVQQGRTRRKRTPSTKSPFKTIHVPWRTKAARKQLSETWSLCSTGSGSLYTTVESSTNLETATTSASTSTSSGHTSPERLSDLSVNPCLGFASEGTPPPSSSGESVSPALYEKQQQQYPPIRMSNRSHIVLRRGRRARTTINYVPAKRAKRIVKRTPKAINQAEESMESMESISTANTQPKCTQSDVESIPHSSNDNNIITASTSHDDEGRASASSQEAEQRPCSIQDQPDTCTVQDVSDRRSLEDQQSESNESQMNPLKSISNDEQLPERILSASPVQIEELTSSTELQHSRTPEVPSAECEVEVEVEQGEDQEQELIVSIPLDALDEDLQRKLNTNEEEEEEEALLTTEHRVADPQKELVESDDVNNNANAENFCQSATADSFNSAVALESNKIEAEPNGGPEEKGDDDMVSLERLAQVSEPSKNKVCNNEATKQRPRAGASSMDFLAEFEKHCEKTLKLQEAKQKMEVEMNDVETTLHGILNEMQDEHLYTPVCTPIDEFLTPADYAPLTEQEPRREDELHQQQQQQQHHTKEGNMFDSSNFTNELIGFQNDMPCFENIEATPQSMAAQQSLQMELTQLLNDLQPAQQAGTAVQQQVAEVQEQQQLQTVQQQQHGLPVQQQQQQQQQLQLQQETVSYEALYQSTPTLAAIAPPPSPSGSNKLQLIQMPTQETLWQTQAQAQAQATGQQATHHLQWSAVGGLEAIKTMPGSSMESVDNNNAGTTTTTYYINASDLYQTQPTLLPGESYTLLDTNENYVLEQHEQQPLLHSQQQQQQQQQQQPIMILIQQPEMPQPVASASNPQQAPLHISYAPPLANELHAFQQLQQQQLQQQQLSLPASQPPLPLAQQQEQPRLVQSKQPQQQVQNQATVLGLPPAVAPPATRSRQPMLKCRFCQNGPRFSNSLEYSRHIIELHPAVAPFTCPHCPQSFSGRSKRNQHILTQHVLQQFHCGQCSQMFPSQRSLDLHLQRFHMPLLGDSTAKGLNSTGVRLEEVQLQMTTAEEKHLPKHLQPRSRHMSALDPTVPAKPSQQRRTRILCCPDCEDCSSASGHHHGKQQYEELACNLQPPPTVLTPPSTIGSIPSPQPLCNTPHITLPSPEQSEPDSTTATLRQFRKRCVAPAPAAATTTTTTSAATAKGVASTTTAATMATTMLTATASPSPSSSPSSSTMETSANGSLLQMGKLRGNHQCVVCDKGFTNIISLRKHQQLAHDSQATMPWVCSICKRGYRKRTDMDNHMKSHEPKGRPYECNECWVRFPEFKQLAMHKFTVHELIKPHTCDECGKQFGTESALKTHIKFHGAHMNTHLPLGVFLNDKHAAPVSSKAESPATPIAVTASSEDSLPMTPLSNCNGGNSVCGSIISEDCPGSVEMVESSIAPSLDMIVDST